MATLRSTFALSVYIDGVAVSLTADLMAESPMAWRRGQTSNAPSINVASPGTLTFSLNNGANNSAGVLGYYSPWHNNRLSGWHIGLKVLLTRSSEYEFVGWITRIDPVISKHETQAVRVTVGDVIDVMAHQTITTAIPTLLSATYAQAFVALVGTLPADVLSGVPGGLVWDERLDAAGPAYMLDTIKRDRPNLLSEMQKLAGSTYSRIFCLADSSICFQVKPYLSGAVGDVGSSVTTVTGDMVASARFPMDRSTIVNTVRGQVTKRTVDSANVTLFQSEAGFTPAVGPGKRLRMKCHFTDPNNAAQRIGGASVVTPVATTDFTFNSLANGTGTNLTASVSVAIQVNGADAVVTFTNNHASSIAYMTSFKIRGKGLYTYNPRKAETTDQASLDTYSSTTLMLDMPYQEAVESFYVLGDGTSIDENSGAMLEILRRFAVPTPVAPSLTFNVSFNFLGGLLNLDIGHVQATGGGLHNTAAAVAITFADTVSGIDQNFFIIGLEKSYDFRTDLLTMTWYLDTLEPPLTFTVGGSGLGEDTILG